MLKAALARSWHRGTSDPAPGTWEQIYLDYLHNRIGKLVNYNVSVRLDMYHALLLSVQQRGFLWQHRPIEVDQNFRISDGAHRAALAWALNESRVTVMRECRPAARLLRHRVNLRKKIQPQTLSYMKSVLRADQMAAVEGAARDMFMGVMPLGTRSLGAPPPASLVLLVWGCAKHLWHRITADVGRQDNVTISSVRPLRVHRLDDFVTQVYAVDDVSAEKVAIKARALAACPAELTAIELRTTAPAYRRKTISNALISQMVEGLKASVRTRYKSRIPNYTHDIIIHGSDNEAVHTRHMERLLGRTYVQRAVCSPSNLLACARGIDGVCEPTGVLAAGRGQKRGSILRYISG